MVMALEPLLVVMDFETTGKDPVNGEKVVQPLQLGAVTSIGGQQMLFNTFMLPSIPIEPGAAEVNGFSVKDNKLTRRTMKGDGEEILSSVSVREGLQQFWAWLEDVGNESGRSVLLAAHNGSGFDFPVLMANMANHGLTVPPSLRGKVQGADTLKAFR